MTEGTVVSIPLIQFSKPLSHWPLENNSLEWHSFPAIQVKGQDMAEGCYGVKIEDESMAPVLELGGVAIFSQNENTPAHLNIYSIGRKGDAPLIRKMVKNEVPATGKGGVSQKGLRRPRKSFMTPTPLHIPGSRISPIAESTHQTIFFKSLAITEKLILVPFTSLLWMHPLVLIMKQGKVE